jgi:type II secretory pathway pseudopilin PulG
VSQYPSPYQPVNYYGPPSAANPLAPARRASILMFVLGTLGLLCGLFMLLAGAVLTPARVAASPQAAQIQQAEAQLGMPIEKIAQLVAAMMGLPALLFLILGFFVYRGSKVGIILSLILTGITLLFLAVDLIAGALGGAANATGMCIMSISIILSGLLFAWLIQAIRASSAVTAMAQQYQAQYAYHQQQLQAYQQQGGYGCGQQQQPYGQQPQYGQPPAHGQQPNYGQQPDYGQPPQAAPPAGPQYGVPPQGPPAAPQTPPQSPLGADSVRHPPLPPSPGDPEGPFGNSPQG